MQSQGIRKLRLRLGLSQERFARLLGVSLQTVRRWESGVSRPLPLINLKLEELQKQMGDAQPAEEAGGMDQGQRKIVGPAELTLGGLFKGLGGLFDLVSRMAEEGAEQYERTGPVEMGGGKAKGVYGFTVRMGLGGKPVVEQFGNIRATEEGAIVAEAREPLVDVLDEGTSLSVIAELPGVEATDIRVQVNEDILELSAETRDRKYSKEILLPYAVEASSIERSYRNGILEIRLVKK